MLAAQGYQESTLDQNKRSAVGAIGVMQLMPATGQALKVGDISVTESNIHGGAKYMDQLMTQYFKDAKFDEQNRTLFAFASYNAGPGNISKMRNEAQKRGLDPDKWFNNVENVTAEKIGIETTTYVRNIFKYYVSYKLTQEAEAAEAKLKAAGRPGEELTGNCPLREEARLSSPLFIFAAGHLWTSCCRSPLERPLLRAGTAAFRYTHRLHRVDSSRWSQAAIGCGHNRPFAGRRETGREA